MSTAPHGIETRFGGVLYRSRLGARWAVLFDAAGWRWEYEPVDLDGYIPDFVVIVPAGPVLVEVKPAYTVENLIVSAADKIDRSGWASSNPKDALIVGATLNPGTLHIAGALRRSGAWGPARWRTCGACSSLSLSHPEQWACFACGARDAAACLDPAPDLKSLWRSAGNAVRWRGRP